MNIIRIMLKNLKLNMRDLKANSMMVLFPIVLIAILGAAFTGSFKDTLKIDNFTVLYTENVSEDGYFTSAFENFRKDLTQKMGIRFEKTDDAKKGTASVEEYKYSAYLQISDHPQEIKLYKNARYTFNAKLLESALNSFVKTYGAMSVIAVNNPPALKKLQNADDSSYVDIRALNKRKQPGSMDYYAVTMLTMILFYAALTGFWNIRGDIEQKTSDRILCAPVRKYELLTGNVLGSISITLLQALVVVIFSKFILKAYWGKDFITIGALVLSYSIMTVSIGAGLAFVLKSVDVASGVINTAIPIFVLLGGGYVPLSVMGSTFTAISNISPVKWINSALFGVIYNNDYSQVAISLGINFAAFAAFIFIAAVFSRKGDGRYA